MYAVFQSKEKTMTPEEELEKQALELEAEQKRFEAYARSQGLDPNKALKRPTGKKLTKKQARRAEKQYNKLMNKTRRIANNAPSMALPTNSDELFNPKDFEL